MSSKEPAPVSSGADADEDLQDLLTVHRLRQFYAEEASRLDDREFEAWLDMLTDDVHYRVPVRTTTAEGGASEFLDLCYVDDNRWRLEKRVERLRTEHAWAERPHTRTRHFVTNVRVVADDGDEVTATSNLLLYLNRGSSAESHVLAGERRDVVRRTGEGLRVAERTVYLDLATLPLDKLSVFV